VVDWGTLPGDPDELTARTAAALRAAPRRELGGWLPADEVAETRLVGAWLAAHDPPALELDERVLGDGRLVRWVRTVESRA
jgi:DNA polymerase III subunit epsilon